MKHVLTLTLLFLFTLSAGAAEHSSAYKAALESIKADDLQRHVARLADDDMEGRESGKQGGRAAAEYIVDHYKKLKINAAGNDGDYYQPFSYNYRNVLAMIEGSDPKLRNQVIIVCAHYDHIGRGYFASLGTRGKIHPGADDNASGTAAVMELAEAMTFFTDPPKRSILFANWDAEEKGLLGSRHWATNPTIDFERVAAVLNFDMLGRLRDDRLFVYGSRGGRGWRRLLCLQNNDLGLHLIFPWGISRQGDHYPFFDRGVPALMFNTGLHEDYHRPGDVAEKIDSNGMKRITCLLFGTIMELADGTAALPAYRAAARFEKPFLGRGSGRKVDSPDRLGVGWREDAAVAGGVKVSSVADNSPADRAGLRVGDLIISFAGRKIDSDKDFFDSVRTARNPVSITVRRGGEEKPLELTANLNGQPLRWGLSWRSDDAEPALVVLTEVVPHSPAARAGLAAGDRIYRVSGKDFDDEDGFARLIKNSDAPLELLVEREGRLSIVTLRIGEAKPLKRAA